MLELMHFEFVMFVVWMARKGRKIWTVNPKPCSDISNFCVFNFN